MGVGKWCKLGGRGDWEEAEGGGGSGGWTMDERVEIEGPDVGGCGGG